MTSFYPGPSQLYPQIADFLQEAYASGILSRNHRSKEFIAMNQQTVALTKAKLHIPNNYALVYASSATECWEIIGQAYLELCSIHLFNGAFGEKWYQYRRNISANALPMPFSIQKMPSLNALKRLAIRPEVICLTQNETSNATQLKNRWLRKVRAQFPDSLVCVDATSSMGGIALDWLAADVWFASVQKCFGMPSGMALMVCSPRAIALAEQLAHRTHHNSLLHILEKARDGQTTHTPSILHIFLLGKLMETLPDIQTIQRTLKERRRTWEYFLRKNRYELLVHNKAVRSDTVLAIKTTPEKVHRIREKAEQADFLLGKGYGAWKENTVRIANFPAIPAERIAALQHVLASEA